jgi:hypothetical protein
MWDAVLKADPVLRFFLRRSASSGPHPAGAVPEIQPNFLSTVHVHEIENVIYEFHLSDKFEPYCIVIAIDRDQGKLTVLSRQQVAHLEKAVVSFKRRWQVTSDSYHYTPWAERQVRRATTPSHPPHPRMC